MTPAPNGAAPGALPSRASAWAAAARAAVQVLLGGPHPYLTTDTVWSLLERARIPPPPEPRQLGSVIRHFVHRGMLQSTGNYARSGRAVCHYRPITVWKITSAAVIAYGGLNQGTAGLQLIEQAYDEAMRPAEEAPPSGAVSLDRPGSPEDDSSAGSPEDDTCYIILVGDFKTSLSDSDSDEE